MSRHWTSSWIGRSYIAGEYECTDLVADVLRAEFGREVGFPRARGRRRREHLVQELAAVYARPLDRPPADGDGVLMRPPGSRRPGSHIGVWCAPMGVPSVLHCLCGTGVVLHALARLPVAILEAEGVYAWLD